MKVCVITGSRSEYYLLEPLIKKIHLDTKIKLQLIVTGMHLHPEFGNTYLDIEKEYAIDYKINLELIKYKDTINESMAIASIEFSKALESLLPDLIIVLGDRFEIFSAATVATTLNIPIAHIHGGELTYGAIDDAFRHAITKMSHLHFTSTEIYKNRVKQMGENPKNIFNVGSLGIENIHKIELLSKNVLEKELNIKFYNKNLLITFHPETISKYTPREQIRILLKSLENKTEYLLIFTKANADSGGIGINNAIESFVINRKNSILFDSLGQRNYFSCLSYVDAVIGNSSSGIIEVPSFNIPTINIGNRQKGRVQAESIINVSLSSENITEAINNLVNIKSNEINNPYEKKDVVDSIISKIKNTSYEDILIKEFHDIK